MTTEWSDLGTVLGALLSIPLFMMGVVMPILAFAGGGHMMGASGGLPLFMALIPLTFLGGLIYLLYRYVHGSSDQADPNGPVHELRSASARGELSDEEFEVRRTRLQTGSASTESAEDPTND